MKPYGGEPTEPPKLKEIGGVQRRQHQMSGPRLPSLTLVDPMFNKSHCKTRLAATSLLNRIAIQHGARWSGRPCPATVCDG